MLGRVPCPNECCRGGGGGKQPHQAKVDKVDPGKVKKRGKRKRVCDEEAGVRVIEKRTQEDVEVCE